MVLGDPTTCIYQFIFDENENNDTKIKQYFIKHGMGLCIKLNSFVAHMLYVWSLSYNKEEPIIYKEEKIFYFLEYIYYCTFLGGVA